MTSNDIAKPDTNTKLTVKRTSNQRNKNILKADSVHKNIEINDEYLEEILYKYDLSMDLTMQIISNDETVRSNTVKDLKEFNSQPLATEVKKREHLVSLMPVIKKGFDLMGDNRVDLSTENETMKNKKVIMMKNG